VPVICIARGGSAIAARHAVHVLSQAALPSGRDVEKLPHGARALAPIIVDGRSGLTGLAGGRSLITQIGDRRGGHEVIIMDASAASDHSLAVAVSLSDLILLPLHIEANDDRAFARDADLIEIAGRNLGRGTRPTVCLASRSASLSSRIQIGISGLLMRRGCETLSAPLLGIPVPDGAIGSGADVMMCAASASAEPSLKFADCVLERLRQTMPEFGSAHRTQVA
jgi:hypothetical protein